MKTLIRTIKAKLKSYLVGELGRQQETLLLLGGRAEAVRVKALGKVQHLEQSEFRVFSQFGEDGIIQYITSKIDGLNKVFWEFGVQNYVESNTRFLLLNDNWQGFVLDGSAADISYIKQDPIFWRQDLTAEKHFVTKENVNEIAQRLGLPKDLGLLSIDVDGNDYWIWQALNVIHPQIVVCEYNSLFGSELAVTIPYKADFYRTSAHYSNLYFGASIKALCILAKEKGYEFVGSNSAGNNAFFVRKDLAGPFATFSAKDGHVVAKFRESRNAAGELSYLKRSAALAEIADLELYDVEMGKTFLIKELQGQ